MPPPYPPPTSTTRASASTHLSFRPNSDAQTNLIISDDVVIEALKRDRHLGRARGATGSQRSLGTSPAPRPNLRFLNNIVQDTATHNAALKLRELESAGDRLRALRGDPPRRKDGESGRLGHGRGYESVRDGEDRYESRDGRRGRDERKGRDFGGELSDDEGVGLRKSRRARRSRSGSRRRDSSFHENSGGASGSRQDRHGSRDGNTSSRHHHDSDTDDRERRHRKRRDPDRRHLDAEEARRRTKRSRTHGGRDLFDEDEAANSSSGVLGNGRHRLKGRSDDRREAQVRSRSPEHVFEKSRIYGRDDQRSSGRGEKRREDRRRSRRERGRSRESSRSRSADSSDLDGKARDSVEERWRRRQREQLHGRGHSGTASRSRSRSRDRCHSFEESIESNRDKIGIRDGDSTTALRPRESRERRSPTKHEPAPVSAGRSGLSPEPARRSRDAETHSSSPSRLQSHSQPHSRLRCHSSSPSSFSSSIGPSPKPITSTPTRDPQQTIPRGRGATSIKNGQSVMDRHFSTSYDPRDDINGGAGSSGQTAGQTAASTTLSNPGNEARARYQASQKQRLLDAGFSTEEVERWEKSGGPVGSGGGGGGGGGAAGMRMEREPDVGSVVWNSSGQGREWDRGKVVGEGDGAVGTVTGWKTGKS